MAVCLVCGSTGPFEQHHVAGRANDPEFTVTVCRGCHRYTLTPWQWVHRIPLEKDSERPELVKSWAKATGALHVIEALTLRLGWDKVAEAIRTLVKLAYAIAGIAESIPEPKVEKLRKPPRRIFRESVEVAATLATMTAYLSAMAMGERHSVTLFFLSVARNPQEWSEGTALDIWAGSALQKLSESLDALRLNMDFAGFSRTIRECLDEFQRVAISRGEEQ
jgi:hypothetical protein